MKRIITLVFVISLVSVPPIINAGGAQESSAEKGEYLAGKGIIVPPQEIFIDSYISSVDYHYPKPVSGVGVSLYAGNHQLSAGGQEVFIQIGIQGRETSFKELPPMNLVFVLDKSISMNEQNKMEWIKESLDVFAEHVRGKDIVSVVVFDNEAEVVFPPTRMRSAQDLMNFKGAVQSINPEGGDNLEAGLMLGYKQVKKNFRKNYSNRVLLMSDGADISEENTLKLYQMVEAFNDEYVNLSTIGVGLGYNLEFMNSLSDKGGGSSRFISDREEMERIFGSDLERTFVPTARNLIMELEFLQGVEILQTWGYHHSIDGNTVNYFLDTLHHRDYETILVQVRILPQNITGTVQEKNLISFTLLFTDLKCKRNFQGPYHLTVSFVDADSPLLGITDGMVLQSATMLHYSQALQKIGELYYSEQFKSAFDLTIATKNEVNNAKLRLGSMGFENEIELLDKYIAILSQHLSLTEAELHYISVEDIRLQSIQGRSYKDDLNNLFREIALVLKPTGNGSILLPGFISSEHGNAKLTSLLNEMALNETSKLPGITVMENERLHAIMKEHNVDIVDLLDIGNAITIGKKEKADYVLIGLVVEHPRTFQVFCRLVNINAEKVEVVPQIILPKSAIEEL
jgi:hypothetical protein